MTRWLYHSEGGGIYFTFGPGFARCLSFKKMFLGDDQKLHEQILKWLITFCGKFNYRTSVNDKTFTPITQEQINKNLIAFKCEQEIQLHIAQRKAGSYDVLHRVVTDPYTESEYDVFKGDKIIASYTTKGSSADEVLRNEVAPHFKTQGYFKIWKPRIPPSSPSGFAPEPVISYYVV